MDNVKAELSLHDDVTLGLMSWAVWGDRDKEVFNRTMRPELEEALGMDFDDRVVWSMDDWAAELLQFHRKKLSRQDLFDMFGKQEVLFTLSRSHPLFHKRNVVLFDDMVEHGLHWSSEVNKCQVKMLNIKAMP